MTAVALAAALWAAPLSVSLPSSVPGDGRTLAAVELGGGPAPLEGEEQDLPDHGSIACQGAPTLPALDASPARVLSPALADARSISCVARLRGEETPFSLRIEPPPPGLYATLQPTATAGQLALSPFRISAQGQPLPAPAVRAATSAGAIERADGTLRIVLPPERAPRAMAVALLDESGAGAAFLPLPGSTQLKLESKRRATLSVRIAGALFGPVQAPDGKAQIRVLVTPGVRAGVVRAVDRLGNVRELTIDLDTPDLPRLAAVASADQVAAGGELRIAIAVAAADGAPAESAALRLSAARGTVSGPSASGPGLVTARYRAPAAPGEDTVEIDLPADPAAGRVQLRVQIVPGPPASVSLQAPREVSAGEEIRVQAQVRDAAGNALPQAPLQASLEGAPARVDWQGEVASVAASAPRLVPGGGAVELTVRSGDGVKAVARIGIVPSEAVAAELSTQPAPRSALVHALVRDRFGNLLGATGFAVVAEGAAVGPVRTLEDGGAQAHLDAEPRAREANATVVAGGRVLARTRIAFDPPPEALLATVWATAAMMTTSGVLSAPRFGLGLGLRRQFGRLEGALLAGLDALRYSDQATFDAAGTTRVATRRLFALAVPVLARVRLPFAGRWGVALEAGPVPTFAWTSSTSDVAGVTRYSGLSAGGRARASVDFALGRGRIAFGASWGTAQLGNGPVRGEIEGRSLDFGYEAWWLDVGR